MHRGGNGLCHVPVDEDVQLQYNKDEESSGIGVVAAVSNKVCQ